MRSRGRRKAPSPGLTAMGDIAFLLITFFVLVSNMASEDQLTLELPKSVDVHTLEAQALARVSVDADRRIYVDGDRVGLEGLEAALAARLPELKDVDAAAVDAEAEAAKAAAEAEARDKLAEARAKEGADPAEPTWDRLVLVKMDKGTDHETWFEVLEILAKLNAQVAIIADKE